MLWLIKKIFIGLLTSIVSAFNRTKTKPAVISLHPNEYSQEFHYYPFPVKLDRCVGSCNTLKTLFNKVYIPNKTEDLNLSMFNMITGIVESKTLIRHISCEWKFRFEGRKCNSDQWWR